MTVLHVGEVELERRPLPQPNPDALFAAMLEGVSTLGLSALPWTESATNFRTRIQSLAVWQPEAGWPLLDDANLMGDLESWLGPWLGGMRRRAHLQRLDLLEVLRSCVPPALLAQVEIGAPRQLAVPSGSQVRLSYQATGESPVLAVKLQELFGMTDSPKVCWGQVPVTVHLLSPAGRPVQVTQDLAGFWRNGYPQVRKELRGRYPRHPWPEDPLTAAPTRRAKPRPPRK